VARDGDVFCPIGSDRIAFYSRKGAALSAPLPTGWRPESLAALTLYTDHAEDAKVSLAGGRVTVAVPANRPVIVFRDAASAHAVRDGR
jgi:hypothetical protein